MKPLRSALLSTVPGLVHGFGTREHPVPDLAPGDWWATRPQWKQVHGTGVAELRGPGAQCGEVDALFSLSAGAPVGVVTADCVPVLLARRRGGAVAGAHAGWKGTRARILRELWKRLAAAGERPGDWVAAIGPSIGPCCYEVSVELADEFLREFREHGRETIVSSANSRHLNLPAINAAELRAIGIAEVEVLPACTRCMTDPNGEPAFHSYRREGGGTRQLSLALVTS